MLGLLSLGLFCFNCYVGHPKRKFTPEEDARLIQLVQEYGISNWIKIASMLGTRHSRRCRERYLNYLSPNVSLSPFTPE